MSQLKSAEESGSANRELGPNVFWHEWYMSCIVNFKN